MALSKAASLMSGAKIVFSEKKIGLLLPCPILYCRVMDTGTILIKGNLLRDLRKQRDGLTQQQVEVALDLPAGSVPRFESGRGFPTIEQLKKLADYYGQSPEQLISSEGKTQIIEVISELTSIIGGSIRVSTK
jgi:plasmid maintenance system antidote protein VapI